ncbi:bifunctional Bromodomain/Bromodomain-like superfamily [Babesia duncani]|uniref:Bifunctional Bromodomain/Bromodomain-like superfamily n=1 Tax=Babesia duncani TaxID=323732 RepID=A0AAD9PIH3_9APIC|nr:bifunctional Bromodomain/Bromodomain-like superfamily [Babesia duncani]
MENKESWTQYCVQTIYNKMKVDRFGSLFATPVLDASDSVIPSNVKEAYKKTIPNPMDYKTVKGKLDTGQYSNPLEFNADMILIYDNCMKFNPPIGVNKWIHDAALASKTKYCKLWEKHEKTVNDLFSSLQTSDIVATEPSISENRNAPVEQIQISQEPEKPHQVFRLSTAIIDDYKRRMGLMSQRAHAETPTTRDGDDDQGNKVSIMSNTLEESIEQEVDSDGFELEKPPLAKREYEGLYQVNWLTENECNQLFPNACVIGLHSRTPTVPDSALPIRCVYNQMYMCDQQLVAYESHEQATELDFVSCDSSRVFESQVSLYSLQEHDKIAFGIKEPRSSLLEPVNIKSGDINDFKSEPIDTCEPIVFEPIPPLVRQQSLAEPLTKNKNEETLQIYLHVDSTISLNLQMSRALEDNGFSKLANSNVFTKISSDPNMSIKVQYCGFYKVDSCTFSFQQLVVRHARLFMVNCGLVQVQILRKVLGLPNLVSRANSACLLYKSRAGQRCVPFFNLPQASSVNFNSKMDILWRSQRITDALERPLVVLHLLLH